MYVFFSESRTIPGLAVSLITATYVVENKGSGRGE